MTALVKRFQSVHPLVVGVSIAALAAGANALVPAEHSGEAVGLIFLLAAIGFALPRGSHLPASHFGLSLGGLLDPEPLSPVRMLKETLCATLQATLVAAIVLPPFWLGYVLWFQPTGPFELERALDTSALGGGLIGWLNLCLVHLLVIALPEEAFFRGYLQTALADRMPGRFRNLGTGLSALLLSSVLFALGHLATTPVLGRLAVFFPSLLFGLLRARTGGVGAAIVLHAQCNVFSAALNAGYSFR